MPRLSLFKKFFLLLILLALSGLGLKGCNKPPAGTSLDPIVLSYWTVWNTQDDFQEIIAKYKALHPNINVAVTKFRYEEYFDKLIEAWAKGQGPDIFSLPNNNIRRYQDFVAPLPGTTKMAYKTVKKRWGIFTEETVDFRESRSLTAKNLKDQYIDVVLQDAVINNQIMALPLSVDTLVLYYNRKLLNQAHIPEPPTTWPDLVADVQKLTILDNEEKVVQAGAALGTSDNIPRATDILSLLMMQNGTTMMTGSRVDFTSPSKVDSTYIPGEKALEFYTGFALPSKETYTWNQDMPDALELFTQGNLAFFFGYSYQLSTIINKGVDFDVTPIPQVNPQSEINLANYWVETVFNRSSYVNEAWDFLQFASKQDNVASYLTKTKRPTVLKALIEYQKSDFEFPAFLDQILTAQSWYRGNDAGSMEESFKQMITSAVEGTASPTEALSLAQRQIQLTIK